MAAKPIKEQHELLVGEVQKNRDEIKKDKLYDFSSVDSVITVVGADGSKQGSIKPPAGVDALDIGSRFKIKIAVPADAAHLPQDAYQMVLDGSYLWKDKAAVDIFNWSEMKDHITNGDLLILTRLEDSGGFKNYQLAGWEVSSKPSGIWVKREIGIHGVTMLPHESTLIKLRVRTGKVEGYTTYLHGAHNMLWLHDYSGSGTTAKVYLFNSRHDKITELTIGLNDGSITPAKDVETVEEFYYWKVV